MVDAAVPLKHAGYAGGAVALTRDVLESAVKKLLLAAPATGTVTAQSAGASGHETDPPNDFKTAPRARPVQSPGPLPALAAPASRKKWPVKFTNTVFLGSDLDLVCYHAARDYVLEARRRNMGQVAVLTCAVDGGVMTVEVGFAP